MLADHSLHVAPGKLPVRRRDEMGVCNEREQPEMQVRINKPWGKDLVGERFVHDKPRGVLEACQQFFSLADMDDDAVSNGNRRARFPWRQRW